LLAQFNEILDARRVDDRTAVDSLYSNDKAVDKAIKLFDTKIAPQSIALTQLLQRVSTTEQRMKEAQLAKERSYSLLTVLLLVMILLFVVAAIAAYLYSTKSMFRPITHLKKCILDIGKGR